LSNNGVTMLEDDADVEDVAAMLDDVMREVEGLELENSVFENYLERQAAAGGEGGDRPAIQAAGAAKRGQPAAHKPPKLATSQKNDIATGVLELKRKEMDDARKAADKLVDTLKAVLEETETRIAELKKDAYEFKRDVVVGGESMRTGRTKAETVTEYMDEKLRTREMAVEKLKLKNQTLKTSVQRAELDLKTKEETGDVLHYIDFHQLQIENKQHVSKLDGLNAELLRLKVTGAAATSSLNEVKDELQALLAEDTQCAKDMELRQGLVAKLDKDMGKVAAQVAAERKTAKRLAQDTASGSEGSGMPQVLDYVGQKAELFELSQVLQTWERKVEIMEMAAKKTRSLKRQATKRH